MCSSIIAALSFFLKKKQMLVFLWQESREACGGRCPRRQTDREEAWREQAEEHFPWHLEPVMLCCNPWRQDKHSQARSSSSSTVSLANTYSTIVPCIFCYCEGIKE
jgi:hypothetical protein